MVKAQVSVGERGRAGGIISAQSEKEAEEAVAKILETLTKGLPIKQGLA
jgi:succinyl-CoA synthetase beta subunit